MATIDTLYAGRSLFCGDRLTSTDDRFILVHQHDGNVVLYVKKTGTPLWASNTWGKNTHELILRENDGRLVVNTREGSTTWTTTPHHTAATKAVMQNDGEFVLKDSKGNVLWKTETYQGKQITDRIERDQSMSPGDELVSKNGVNKFVFQEDGNLAVIKAGRTVWNSQTAGTNASTLILQVDGNFVMYNDSSAVWASDTWRMQSEFAIMQDDGNFVIYADGGAKPVWAADTAHL